MCCAHCIENIQNIAPLAVIVQYSFDLVIWIGRSLWWVLLPITCFVPKTLKIKYKCVHLHFGWRLSIIISKGIWFYGQKFVFSFSRIGIVLNHHNSVIAWTHVHHSTCGYNPSNWSHCSRISFCDPRWGQFKTFFMLSWTLLPNADTELHKQIAEIVSIVLKTQQKC